MCSRILSRRCGFDVLVEGEDESPYGPGQETTPSAQSRLWVSVFTCFHLLSLAFTSIVEVSDLLVLFFDERKASLHVRLGGLRWWIWD